MIIKDFDTSYVNSLFPTDEVILLDIPLGNILLFDGTKPLPELMPPYHQNILKNIHQCILSVEIYGLSREIYNCMLLT